MVKKITKTVNFEQSLQQLETLVDTMESGELNLEESLATFEKGIKLTKACQQALTDAEQKVQVLMEENGNICAVDGDDLSDLGDS